MEGVRARCCCCAIICCRSMKTGSLWLLEQLALAQPSPGAKLALHRDVELKAAFDRISSEHREMLVRTAARIRTVAIAQKSALTEVTVPIPGGEAGHTVEPVEVAGCYAPGGRYLLPSTVLMTAVTARAAGCKRVIVASPSSRETPKSASLALKPSSIRMLSGLTSRCTTGGRSECR